ncbi:MAG: hypothetical protein J3R72DRAFT_418289 [Linnemannia gamsii]|nr:MAG: hypothetical protein J3R72DRAFT_418289 [Linnemannia gamsii]
MPLLTQLDLLDEYCNMSRPVRYITVHKENDNMRPMGRVAIEEHVERSGYATTPLQSPQGKIHVNHRIISIHHQDANTEVRIESSKGQSFTGDTLVGADGAYSNVRQSL